MVLAMCLSHLTKRELACQALCERWSPRLWSDKSEGPGDPGPLAIAGYGSENAYSLLFAVPKPKLLYPEPQ